MTVLTLFVKVVVSSTDIQSPSIQCPASLEVLAEKDKSYAIVTWRLPVPTDNSNEQLNLTGLRPPQQLQVGHTKIVYYVEDSAGLNKSCVFSVKVKGTAIDKAKQ